MLRITAATALALVLFFPVTATAENVSESASENTAPQWHMVKEESSIIFNAKQMGSDIRGRIENFEAEIFFDPEALSESRVTVTVYADSINSDYDTRDDTLKGPEWFAADRYPAVTYQCADFERTDSTAEDGTYLCRGELTIREVTAPLDLPFRLTIAKDNGKNVARMTSETVMQRLQYRLGRGDWADSSIIHNDVRLEISVTAHK